MRIRLAVLAVLLAAPAPLRAQTGTSDLMTRAVRAYQDLEFDRSAYLLRRVLVAPVNELDDSTRARALTYLGASEHYRGNADSAMAAFRRLVALAPQQAPDTLIFPPEVTGL